MNLCISSLAWHNDDRLAVYQCLQENNVPFVEIVLSKFTPNVFDQSIEFFLEKKGEWEQFALKAVSLQSIHFGVDDAFLFRTETQRQNLLRTTKKIIDIASALEIPNLVFGSPKLRILPENGDSSAAIPFFGELNTYAHSKNCHINLEANSSQYGTNFLTGTQSVKDFVYAQNWSNIGINLDLSTMILENEDITEILADIHKVRHAHVSTPFLKTNFCDFSEQIKEYILAYKKTCRPRPGLATFYIPEMIEVNNLDTLSIEMVSQTTDLDLIQNTIKMIKEYL